jgi:hypothetical protein
MQVRTVLNVAQRSFVTTTDVRISDVRSAEADEKQLVLPSNICSTHRATPPEDDEQEKLFRKWRAFPGR